MKRLLESVRKDNNNKERETKKKDNYKKSKEDNLVGNKEEKVERNEGKRVVREGRYNNVRARTTTKGRVKQRKTSIRRRIT